MKIRERKILSILLVLLLILSSFPDVGFAEGTMYSTQGDHHHDENVRVIVKYNDNYENAEKNLTKEVSKNNVISYSQLESNNTYIMEVTQTEYESMINDKNIESIELDNVFTLLENVTESNGVSAICVHENGHCCAAEESCICDDCPDCHLDDHNNCNCGADSCAFDHHSDTCSCSVECKESHSGNCDENCEEHCNGHCEENCEENGCCSENIGTCENCFSDSLVPVTEQLGWNLISTRANELHEMGITGKGVKVAIFDTGINTNSTDINLAGGVSFVENSIGFSDDNGHGTKMASVLASNINNYGMVGFAPDIELYSVKVLDKEGIGRYSAVLNGVEWAIENKIDIITMSFGGDEYSEIVHQAIEKAAQNGILVVASAGNAGVPSLYYPAAFSSVVSVGATDENNKLASFSNYGDGLDIVAPGVMITTYDLEGKISITEGTSVAAQEVAGVAALFKSADPCLNDSQLKYMLYGSSQDKNSNESSDLKQLNAMTSFEKIETKQLSQFKNEKSQDLLDLNRLSGRIETGVLKAQATCVHSWYNSGGYVATHPHRGYDICSKCGSTRYRNDTHDMPSCIICHPTTCSHTYSNACDTTCNKCGGTRSVSHSYDNSCDSSCNWCGATRYVSHSYTNSCDASCNLCGYTRSVSHSYTGGNCRTASKCSLCGASGPYGDHTWYNSGGYTSAHPHYGYDICSTCSSTRYNSITRVLSTCCICNSSSGTHRYSSSCDASCDVCGKTRPVTHTFKYACDTECQICHSIRPNGGHAYSTTCDEYCIYCHEKTRTTSHDYGSVSYYQVHHSGNQDRRYRPCKVCGYIQELGLVPCTCHTHSYSSKIVSPTHTTSGHYYYWQCSCGDTSGGGYQKLSTCTACTTAPSVSFAFPSAGQFFSETTGMIYPQIYVQDNENDTLTCKYYIDGSTTPIATQTVIGTNVSKLVTFTTGYNISSLAEGSHTIKVDVTDGISPVGTATRTFKVDKTLPKIDSITFDPSTDGFLIQIAASDSISGLASQPYKVIYDGVLGPDWTSNNILETAHVNKPNALMPITIYVKDATGHIYQETFNKWTNPNIPVLNLSNIGQDKATLEFSEDNPKADTLYEIKVGEEYLNSDGTLVSNPVLCNFSQGQVEISGLLSGTTYQISARAMGPNNIYTLSSEAIYLTTKLQTPAIPVQARISHITQTGMLLEWDDAQYASAYVVNVNGVDITPECNDTNLVLSELLPDTEYSISVKAVNSGGSSDYSEVATAKTQALLGVEAQAVNDGIDLNWEPIQGISQYQIMVDDNQVYDVTGNNHKVLFDQSDVMFSIKIRAITDKGLGDYSTPVIVYSLSKPVSNIQFTNVTSNSLDVTWDKLSNPESVQYQVVAYERKDGVTSDVPFKANNWTYASTVSLTGLRANQEYAIRINTRNSEAKELLAESINEQLVSTLNAVPESPINVISTIKDTSITLKWDPVYNAKSYRITRDSVTIATISDTSYVDLGDSVEQPLIANTEYTYQIYAINDAGEGSPCLEMIKRTLPTAPLKPEGIISSVTKTSINLIWNEVINATGYDVEFNGSIKNAGIANQFTMNGLEAGTYYTYRVRSRNEGGKSEWSELKTIQTAMVTPAVPMNISLVPSENKIEVYWQASSNASAYIVELSGVEIGTTAETYYEIQGLNPATSYDIRIRATNAFEESDWSALYNESTLSEISGSTNILSVQSELNTISVEWADMPEAIGYMLRVDGVEITPNINLTNYDITNLLAGHSYVLEIGTIYGDETIIYTNPTRITTLPENVNNVTYEISNFSAMIRWEPTEGATGYEIEINGTKTDIGNIEQYFYGHIASNQNIAFRVRAYNQGGFGTWSDIVEMQSQDPNKVSPSDIRIDVSDNNAFVSWENIKAPTGENAYGYEYMINGGNPQIVNQAIVDIQNLTADTVYTFEVRTLYDAEGNSTSDWSERISFNTEPIQPQTLIEITLISTGDSVNLSWDAVEGVSGYELLVDGIVIPVGVNTHYLDAGLAPLTEHTYQIRAVVNGIRGIWSEEKIVFTQVGMPGVPLNIVGTATKDSVTFRWSAVDGASAYLVQVGDAVDLITVEVPEITIEGLDKATLIAVKVSALTNEIQGPYSGIVSCSTAIDKPTNLSFGYENSILVLNWDAVEFATKYEVEVDGLIVGTTTNLTYSLENIVSGTAVNVRIRAKNDLKAKSDWTEVLRVQAAPVIVEIQVDENEVFDMSLKGNGITDFTDYTFTIEYDTAVLELIDLYSLSDSIELSVGNIIDTDLKVLYFEPGKVVFKLTTNILPGREWSGLINAIKFKAYSSGQALIKYSVQ